MTHSDKLLEELLTLLKVSDNDATKIHASKCFSGLTGSAEGQSFISESKYLWLETITEHCDDNLMEVSKNCLISIVNLSAEVEFCAKMIIDSKLFTKLITCIAESKFVGPQLELASKALSNLAQSESSADQICRYIDDKKTLFYDALALFYTPSIDLHFFANFLSNITQVKEGRNLLVNRNKDNFVKLLSFVSNRGLPVRQMGVVATVHNCVFDIENHDWFLSPEVDILPYLLLPLAGPEEFDDEDNDLLPPDLQYLEPTKMRDPNPVIRKMLIESISKLCCTKHGRRYVKSKNAYVIMRELHKWEKNEESMVALENLIQLLISDEPEDSLADLHTVPLSANVSR